MIPLPLGFLVAGPISGILSDRFGARPFATGGMVAAAICFALIEVVPVNFSYLLFGPLLFLTGLSMAAFGSPNRAGVMNSLPPEHRGAGSGMNTTFQNSAQVFSIGIFFSLMIIGLSTSLPGTVYHGLVAHGVAPAAAIRAAHLPPVSTLFAAFLGYNPVAHLIGAKALAPLSPAQRGVLLGHGFFPALITAPFRTGLRTALDFAIFASLLAAAASCARGGRYVYQPPGAPSDSSGAGSANRPATVAPNRPGTVAAGRQPALVGDGHRAVPGNREAARTGTGQPARTGKVGGSASTGDRGRAG